MDASNLDIIKKATASDQPGAVVCTLGLNERADRGLEWADLGELSLTSERIDGGVASTYRLSMADAVEALADSENSCCGSWLQAATERLDEVIRLEITTESPAGLDVILSMAGHAK